MLIGVLRARPAAQRQHGLLVGQVGHLGSAPPSAAWRRGRRGAGGAAVGARRRCRRGGSASAATSGSSRPAWPRASGPSAASSRLRSSIAISELSPIAPSALRGSSRAGASLSTLATPSRTTCSSSLRRSRGVAAADERSRRPARCRPSAAAGGEQLAEERQSAPAPGARGRPPSRRAAPPRRLQPAPHRASRRAPCPRSGEKPRMPCRASSSARCARRPRPRRRPGLLPHAPGDAQRRQPARAPVEGERVEAGVGGGVVGLAWLRQERASRREQHEEVEVGQQAVEELRAARAWAAATASKAARSIVAARPVVERAGGVDDAADRRPALAPRTAPGTRGAAPRRRRPRRRGAPRRPRPPARAPPRCAGRRRWPGRGAGPLARAAAAACAPAAPGAARRRADHGPGHVQAEVAQPAGDEVGGVLAPGERPACRSGSQRASRSAKPLAVAQRHLVLAVGGAEVARQERELSRPRRAAPRVEIDQAAPQLGVLLGHHPRRAPQRAVVHVDRCAASRRPPGRRG